MTFQCSMGWSFVLMAILAATGNPTLAGAAGGAAQSATEQYASTGTVDGGQVMKDAAVGMAGGKMGAMASKALGCATNKVVKAVAGAAADAGSGAGTQVVDNVLSGRPAGEGVAEAALGSLPGAGIVTGVMQRESCFLAGTSVTLGTGDRAMIETLRVGQRVSTPESVGLEGGPLTPVSGTLGSDGSETAVDPTTWRSYTVRLRDGVTKWDVFDITLLRPAGWMESQARQVEGHAEVWVDFEELNAKGWAEVIEEAPCPPIAAGKGRVITATITHANDDVRTLTMSSGETLYVTGNHRMYSATRQDWVPVKALRIGEELQTTDGRKSVASLGFQKGRHQVYNIEVEAEHCYFVGHGEVLTHNGCEVYRALSASDRESFDAGESLKPKGTEGSITDHVEGKPTPHISASETIEGTRDYDHGHGVVAIDTSKAPGFTPHKNVMQAVKKDGTAKAQRDAKRAGEVLFKGEIPRDAMRLVKKGKKK